MVADDDDFRGRNFEKTDGGGAGNILCELTDDSNLAVRWRFLFSYFSVLSSGGKVAFYDRQWAMWRLYIGQIMRDTFAIFVLVVCTFAIN